MVLSPGLVAKNPFGTEPRRRRGLPGSGGTRVHGCADMPWHQRAARGTQAGGAGAASGATGGGGGDGGAGVGGYAGAAEGRKRVAGGRCRSRARCNGGGRHRRGQNGYCLYVDLSTSTQAWPVMITPLPGPFLTLTLSEPWMPRSMPPVIGFPSSSSLAILL